MTLQFIDAILTGIGISHFGHSAEGNPFLRHLMGNFGVIPVLLITKLAAIGIIFALYRLSIRVSWVPLALKLVCAVYVFGAVVPWTTILVLKTL